MQYTFSRLILTVLLGLTIFSCHPNNSNEEPVVELDTLIYEKEFSVGVLTYMAPMSGLDDKAIIEYGYIEKKEDADSNYLEDEIYMTIVSFNKNETYRSENDSTPLLLENLNDLFFVNFNLLLDDLTEENPNPPIQKLNDLNYIQNSFRGKLGGYGVYYKLTIFESEDKFYQMLVWCLDELKEKHKLEIESIANSFKKI